MGSEVLKMLAHATSHDSTRLSDYVGQTDEPASYMRIDFSLVFLARYHLGIYQLQNYLTNYIRWNL